MGVKILKLCFVALLSIFAIACSQKIPVHESSSQPLSMAYTAFQSEFDGETAPLDYFDSDYLDEEGREGFNPFGYDLIETSRLEDISDGRGCLVILGTDDEGAYRDYYISYVNYDDAWLISDVVTRLYDPGQARPHTDPICDEEALAWHDLHKMQERDDLFPQH